ncbi:MAG TPA: WD40 repeat domain-containing protein [Chthonomonadaceae bacterium]|nr:WD40 repeat domain-containing protein [Chthonomonadaceae bacterium]
MDWQQRDTEIYRHGPTAATGTAHDDQGEGRRSERSTRRADFVGRSLISAHSVTASAARTNLGRRTPSVLRFVVSNARRRLAAFAVLLAAISVISALAALPSRAQQSAAEEPALPIVITGGSDHAVKHWDAAGRLLGGIGMHVDAVTALAYAQGELVCAINDGKIKGINLSTGKTDYDVKAHAAGAIALALATDGSLLATGGADGALRLWDGKTGHFLTVFQKAHGGAVTALRLTSDHAHLVSGSADRMIRIWRISGDSKHPSIEYAANIVAHDDAISGLSLSPDDKLIASVSGDGSLRIWNLASGAIVQRVRLSSAGVSVGFSPDGRTVATGAADGRVRLWNPDSGLPLPFAASHERAVTALAWTPDGNILVTGGEDKTLRYWSLATGQQLARITAHDGAVRAIVLPQPTAPAMPATAPPAPAVQIVAPPPAP